MRNVIYIILSCLLFACQEKGQKQLEQIVEAWMGKEVVFPHDIAYTRFAKDTVSFVFSAAKYKVLVYVDSGGCTSCRLQLPKWKEFIHVGDYNGPCELELTNQFGDRLVGVIE